MARPTKIDWSEVDWSRTNAEIALGLGGVRTDTVSRARAKRGHPTVNPRFLPRIAELEREVGDLRVLLRMEEAHTEPCTSTVACPFCGCDKLRVHRSNRFPGVEFIPDCGSYAWAVVCNACASEGPWRKSDTADSAIKAWEQRAAPIMDAVRARPGLEHVKGTDAELLRRVLRSTDGWEPGQVRWSHVASVSGHGSTVGHALCVAVGVDPNERGPKLDEEVCGRCGAYLLDRDDDTSEEAEDDEEPEDDAPEAP